MAVVPDKLPLALKTRRSYPPDAIPLPLGGQDDSGGGNIGPRVVTISSCSAGRNSPAYDVGNCASHRAKPALAHGCMASVNTLVLDIGGCHRDSTAHSPHIVKCSSGGSVTSIDVANCAVSKTQATIGLKHCSAPTETASVLLRHCVGQPSLLSQLLKSCRSNSVTRSILLTNCATAQGLSAFLHSCQREQYQHAVRPPCEFYPLPLPPPPPDLSPCRIRPPSDRLPLRLTRVRINRDSAQLRLPLNCWHDDISNDIPALNGYIMHNEITAEFNGQSLEILGLTISTDTDAFCWQADLTLPPADFAKLNIDGRQKGDEAVITIRINGQRWDILAEDYRDMRKFVGHSYTVTGRSITAKLSADYAKGINKRYSEARYARQIADDLLQYLPYQIAAWEAVDWLVTADNYVVSNQTPIGVISDIAHAAGAFVESHPYEPQLFIRPLWAKAAWENPSAALTIPANLILSISGQRRVGERYNSVRLSGMTAPARGALVYRTGTDQTPEAGILTHALYTDDPVLLAAGQAVLSETGTHKIETVTLPWAEKYQLPLAQLGKVWAFAEGGNTWQGLIKGVSVEVTLDNDAPVVTQTVTIDRYLGG